MSAVILGKNACLRLKNGEMDYICFGSGTRTLVMLPGVGDGLKTVRGKALPFALLYRKLSRDFTVYVFSRRRQLPGSMSTREMAEDVDEAMTQLGLRASNVVGVSQGGMIAQWLAIDHPDKVGKLVLTVTLGRPNDTLRQAIGLWTEMAKRGDYRGIMLDMGRPRSFDRFLTQAGSCLTHDAYDRLDRIACPTLVIGGTEDRIVTGQASRELAERIPGAELVLYQGLGHGLYEEAPDFLERVAAFCR